MSNHEQIALDEKALDAAWWAVSGAGYGHLETLIADAIRTYLAALVPSDVAGLCERVLRADLDAVHEAASTLQSQASALAAAQAENAALKAERDKLTCRVQDLKIEKSHIEAERDAALAAAQAEIEALNGALKLAEFMLTKDSLCDAERIEEGLIAIRRARKGGSHD